MGAPGYLVPAALAAPDGAAATGRPRPKGIG
jgi:hypothetical protein